MSGPGVDPSLRDRLSRSSDAALKAFDDVLADTTPEHIEAFRAALDELMRAAARTWLELERDADHGNGRP